MVTHKMRILKWIVLMLCSPSLALALMPGPDGYFVTGSGVRQKAVLMLRVDVFAITHAMKELPKIRSKEAVINAACDKRFVMKFLRDVDVDRATEAFRGAFKLIGYGNNAKINLFLSVIKKDIQEKDTFLVSYNSERRLVYFSVKGQGSIWVPGEDFMKAVWSIWLGKIDQPSLSDALISRIP